MSTGHHWIALACRASAIPGAEELEIPVRAAPEDAWTIAMTQLNIDAWLLADAISSWFRLETADLTEADPLAVKLLPGSVARQFNVYPLFEDDRRLVVATANPIDVPAEQEIGFVCGRTVVFQVAPPTAIARCVDARYAPDEAAASILQRIDPDAIATVTVIEEDEGAAHEGPVMISEDDAEGGPIVRLTNMILEDAVQKGASDIHVQPTANTGVVRLRIDGVLQSGISLPLPVMTQVISRVKIMSRLDISDRMRPQDGRARVQIGDRRLDLRISTVPARGGEKAVIRILDSNQSRRLEESGIAPRETERLRRALRARDGIIVVTGPTGSGKTTTMYAVLQEIATSDVNIMTVEDPVEYELPGLTQIQVDVKKGVTFQSALRAILRQDPDVIFVGEIRDQQTAEMAAQASLTGHLVLATVHANDAVGSVRRFLDLGLDPATVSETLRAALAQRLLRTLCTSCALPNIGRLDAEEAEFAARFNVKPQKVAVGCEDCGFTGYRGRVPVVELLTPTKELLNLVSQEASHLALTDHARADGMRTLLQGGLNLVRDGKTSLSEMVRVLGEEAAVTMGLDDDRGPSPAPEPTSGVAAEPAQDPRQTRSEAPSRRASASRAQHSRSEPDDSEADSPREVRILLVDDSEESRLFAKTVLEGRGWKVEEAVSGKEALLKAGGLNGHSLIVLDLGLPDIDGRDILPMLKQNLSTAAVPIIVLTGRTDRETEKDMLQKGADDYIKKPLDPAIFIARVRAALRRTGY